eukprot:TRINITY_DN11324_c0_g2_i1.p1 TRINITY_DN11324_c0_g2~~TRINITY_DN11324_c0_g2_i1.p1  ORF type:complete len:456 (+),score=153.44 TRINITY_DN11324_c0_g2_i1:1189-2556(+)
MRGVYGVRVARVMPRNELRTPLPQTLTLICRPRMAVAGAGVGATCPMAWRLVLVLAAGAESVLTQECEQQASMASAGGIVDRVKGALFGMCAGDALAMPVHWYYDRRRIFTDFGRDGITKYESPKKSFQGSIMNLSNTGGGGRGSDQGDIIGRVILHDKKQYWLRGGNYHYHHGMAPGENTLDTQVVTKLLMPSMTHFAGTAKAGTAVVDRDDYLSRYVKFFTTPNTHNDVYAATAHRMFFANFAGGKPPAECADNDGHNTDAIDGLLNVIPMAMRRAMLVAGDYTPQTALGFKAGNEDAAEISRVINYIRRSSELPGFGVVAYELLVRVMLGADLKAAVLASAGDLGRGLPRQIEAAARDSDDPMTACYVSSSFPALLVFAYKYADSPFRAALCASANAGGENVNRGSLLGAVMGAAHGFKGVDGKLVKGLVAHDEIEATGRAFIDAFHGGAHL